MEPNEETPQVSITEVPNAKEPTQGTVFEIHPKSRI